MITLDQFNILIQINNKDIKIINDNNYKYLIDNNYIYNNTLTNKGILELNKYKIDNAIIMAAGKSTRFTPLSLEKHKALTIVNGEVLIERQIKQLIEKNINNIIIVVGYLKEQFEYLVDKYNVTIIENNMYNIRNNNSSIYVVKDYLRNSYICSSDNYFMTNVFEEYNYQAFYSSIYVKGNTDEYCLTTDNNNLITNVKIGGNDSYIMLGHVYFDETFSNKFINILESIYNKEETKNLLWEQIYMQYINELHMYIKPYNNNCIFEFDTIDELRLFDNTYINNIDSNIIRNICNYFKCNINELTNFCPCTKDVVGSFTFNYNNNKYNYNYNETSYSIIMTNNII